jgi:hypothetical protein
VGNAEFAYKGMAIRGIQLLHFQGLGTTECFGWPTEFKDQSRKGAFLYFHVLLQRNEIFELKIENISLNEVPIFLSSNILIRVSKSLLLQ